MEFIKQTIEVKIPEKEDKEILYSDMLIYLVKTVSQLDPKYEYLLGLAFYSITKGLSSKQKRLANDLITYFCNKEANQC